MDVIAIEEVLDENSRPRLGSKLRKAIAEADVIVGVDTKSPFQFTIFGTPALEETLPVGKDFSLRTVRIGIARDSGQRDALLALVQAIKSGQDQLAGDE